MDEDYVYKLEYIDVSLGRETILLSLSSHIAYQYVYKKRVSINQTITKEIASSIIEVFKLAEIFPELIDLPKHVHDMFTPMNKMFTPCSVERESWEKILYEITHNNKSAQFMRI